MAIKVNDLIHSENISMSQSTIKLMLETIHDPTYPKVSIVTPNFNGGKFLEETILSVIGQNYPNLEYIVIDGGSTDNSLHIIEKYSKFFAYWESKPDNGLYHGLQKGFEKSSGEIMGWINSDDILQKKSLFAVSEIFSNNPRIQWIQGYPVVIDEMGRIVYHRPHVSSKYFFYLKDYHDGRFIQQESTFWKRTLWDKAGGYISTQNKYAGDFELWIRFFQHEQLYITNTIIGAFRMRGEGQISRDHFQDYLLECDQIIDTILMNLPKQENKILQKEIRRRECQIRFPKLFKLFLPFKTVLYRKDENMINFDLNEYKFKIDVKKSNG